MTRVVVVAVALLALVGCGVRPERAPTAVGEESVPFSLLQTTTTASTVPAAEAPVGVQVCLHDGDTVVAVNRGTRTGTVADALRAYATGPTAEERARGLSSALFAPSLVTDVEVAGGVATIELAAAFAQAGTSTQLDIVAEVVCTVTAQPGVGQVSFRIDGEPIEVPRGDGSLAADPVSRDDYPGVIP